MSTVLLIVALMAATVVVVAVGERIHLPWPVLLTLLTAGAFFLPDIPDLPIDAHLILPLFLPPLLWALARRTSWGMIRSQWRSILSLSVMLVFVTIAAVTGALLWVAPGIGFAAAMAFAAAVAPPDPVSVEAVAGPAGIPRRVTGTLQTEGLFNDAASIVAFTVAVAALEGGEEVHWLPAMGDFAYTALAAVVLGWLFGRGSALFLGWVQSTVAGNAWTWVVPFLTYAVAEEIHASGVIAVVVAAVELTSRTDATAAEDRLVGNAFWEVAEMLITGLAFGLIGLSVRNALTSPGVEVGTAVWWGVVSSAVLIGVRTVWMTWLWRLNLRAGRTRAVPMRGKETLLLVWAGMRGLVTLALVLSLSPSLPMRDEFLIAALVVLLCTMVLPGLTLPLLMRVLGRSGDLQDNVDVATERALDRAHDAAVDVVHRAVEELPAEVSARIIARLGSLRSTVPFDDRDSDEAGADDAERQRRLTVAAQRAVEVRRAALEAALQSLASSRSQVGVDPDVISEKMSELDLRLLSLGHTAP